MRVVNRYEKRLNFVCLRENLDFQGRCGPPKIIWKTKIFHMATF